MPFAKITGKYFLLDIHPFQKAFIFIFYRDSYFRKKVAPHNIPDRR
ncbi:Uncharacterised protein [Serratia marcescens]|nr:Uncharacterised protein [Serratia marcescens]